MKWLRTIFLLPLAINRFLLYCVMDTHGKLVRLIIVVIHFAVNNLTSAYEHKHLFKFVNSNGESGTSSYMNVSDD